MTLLALLAGALVIACGSAATSDSVTTLAKELEDKALQWIKESGIEALEKAYADGASNATFEDVVGGVLVSTLSTELARKVFEPKIEAIKYAVNETEKIAASYKWQAHPQSRPAMLLNETSSIRHQKPVDFNQSGVHVPVDIFKDGKDILNGLSWTDNLTQIFMANQARHPDLLWQYFGSHQGFLRYYPGATWDTEGETVDLYDARRRPWYIQGSSSPKDMLILIDSSGSTLGQTLYLMKLTVRLLLETLGEDDFVLVANFSEKANLVTDCFESFVQATALNKQILNDAIELIDPQKQANFTAALEFAFKHFEKLENARNSPSPNRTFAGSGCNKLIVMLTDGGSDRPEELIRHHDPEGNKYRIFTYAVGQSPSPVDAVKWIACANHGWYSRIENIGAIKPSIQKYIEVLADVMAQHSQGGPIHHLSDVYRSDLGSQMLTTLTMPVYNKSQPGNVTFLGVMGIDVPMQQITNLIPRLQMGSTGYAFAINHNGFVLFHPWLKTQDATPVDPPSIDIIDLEHLGHEAPNRTDKKDEMRQKMVDGDADSKYVYDDTLVLYGDLKYVRREKRSYFASKIPNTSYSLGISLPESVQKYVNFSSSFNKIRAVEVLLKLTANKSMALYLTAGDYCRHDTTSEFVTVELVIECLNTSLEMSHNNSLLHHLVWDAEAVYATLGKKLELSGLNMTKNQTHYLFRAISGLTLMYPSGNGGDVANESNDSGKDEATLFHPENLAAAAERAYHVPDEIVFAVLSDSSRLENTSHIAVLKAININGYTPSVSGLSFAHENLQEILSGSTACRVNNTCYLLDEGGYVIASSDNYSDNTVGKFIGVVDRSLLHLMLNISVYEMFERLDYQGVAKKQPKTSSASQLLKIGTVSQFVQAVVRQWWSLASFYALQLYSILSSLVFVGHMHPAVASSSIAGSGNVPTVNLRALYMYGSAASLTIKSHSVDQADCHRSAMVRRINGTNLLLVITDKLNDDDSCASLPLKSVYGSEQPLGFLCKRAARYRNSGAQPCHRHHKQMVKYKCGASVVSCISAVKLVALSFIATLLHRLNM